MAVKGINDEEIFERGYKAIVDELGIAGFTRFIRLTQGGKGNWTEERGKALKSLNKMSIDKLVDFIKKNTKGTKER